MIKLQGLLEDTDSGTFQMYHGGKRWSRIPTELIGSAQGRYESGVGIYLTNSYNTARKYAQGSRVVHLVDIDKNFKDINDVHVPLKDVLDFVRTAPRLKYKEDISNDLKSYIDRVKNSHVMKIDTLSLNILNNLIVNYEAGAGNAGIAISNYFVSKGADALLENKSGDEVWLVVFNPNIIKKVSVVDPKMMGSDFAYMLPAPRE
jgi:hypothetical protein